MSLALVAPVVDRRGKNLWVGCTVALAVDRRMECGIVKSLGPLFARIELLDDGPFPSVLTRQPWKVVRVED